MKTFLVRPSFNSGNSFFAVRFWVYFAIFFTPELQDILSFSSHENYQQMASSQAGDKKAIHQGLKLSCLFFYKNNENEAYSCFRYSGSPPLWQISGCISAFIYYTLIEFETMWPPNNPTPKRYKILLYFILYALYSMSNFVLKWGEILLKKKGFWPNLTEHFWMLAGLVMTYNRLPRT